MSSGTLVNSKLEMFSIRLNEAKENRICFCEARKTIWKLTRTSPGKGEPTDTPRYPERLFTSLSTRLANFTLQILQKRKRRFVNNRTLPERGSTNQTLLILASSRRLVGEQRGKQRAKRYWISMLWSTDTCQNKVSADQCHVTISRAQVNSSSRSSVFWSWSLTRCWVFDWIGGSCLVNLLKRGQDCSEAS